MRLRPGPAVCGWLLLLTAAVQLTAAVSGADEACTVPRGNSDGGWSAWNRDNSGCGVGYRTRSRTCDNPLPRNNGTLCEGPLWDIQPRCRGVFDCDFETGMCGWTQDSEDDFDWSRHKGSTSTENTGPPFDHTMGVCPIADYVSFKGVCYRSFKGPKTRDGAKKTCAGDGGILAMPKDSATNAFLASLSMVVNGRWLGLTDANNDSQWVFEDGTNLTSSDYSNWYPGEPKPYKGQGGCVGFFETGSLWDEKDCNLLRGFICQLNEGVWLSRDPSWVVETSGTPWVNNSVTYDAAKVLDGDNETYWNPQGTPRYHNNWYIILDLSEPQTLTRIALNNYGDTDHDIAAFTLQKSQVGSPYNWEDVASVNAVQGGTGQRQEFGGFQGTAWYWKFVATRTHGGWKPWLKELYLYAISFDGNGHYMYIEASLPRVTGDSARLYSPTVTTACTKYLRFWYHMYGSTIGTMNVYVRTDTSLPTVPVFTSTGDRGNQWLRVEVEISITGSYHVVVEGICGSAADGDIAVDDITLTTGHCATGACSSEPCQSYGTCVEDAAISTGYTCLCLDGWEGENCTQAVDECQSSPCGPGTCHDRLNGYLCQCPLGYNGTHCEEQDDLPVKCSTLGVCEHTIPDDNTAGSCWVNASIVEGVRAYVPYDGRIRLVYRASNVLHGAVDLTGCPGGNVTKYQWNVFVEVLSGGNAVYNLPNLKLKADEKDLVLPSQSLQPWKYMIQVTVQDTSTEMKVYSVAQTWVEVLASPLLVTLGPSLVTRPAHEDLWVSAEGSWDPEGLADPSKWDYTWTCNQTHGGSGVFQDCAALEIGSRPGALYIGNSQPAKTTFSVTVVASTPGRGDVTASQTVVLHDNPTCQLSITCARNCDHTRLDPAVPLQLQAVPGTNASAMYHWSVEGSPDAFIGLPTTVDVTREKLLVEANVFEAGESYKIRLVNRFQDCSNDSAVAAWVFRVRPGGSLGSASANCSIHRNDSGGCVCCEEVTDELGPVTYKFRIFAPYKKDRGHVQFPPGSDFLMTTLPLRPYETMIPRYCLDVLPQDALIVQLWVSAIDGRLVAQENITETLSEEEAAPPDDVIEILSKAEMKDLGTIQDVATLVTLGSAKNLTLASKATAAKTLQASADALKAVAGSGSSLSAAEINIIACTMFTGMAHMLEDSSNASSNAEDNEEVKQIVGAVYNTADSIAETYLNTLMAKESNGATVIFQLPKLHFKVQKGGCQEEQRKILVVQDLVVVTPSFRDLSSGCSEDDTVGVVLTEAKFNPFQYAGNSAEIRSEVVSMTVRVGREIKPVNNLPDPIDMIIRRDQQDVTSTMFTHAGIIQSDSDIAVAEFRPQKSGTALSIYLDVEQTPEPRDIRLVLQNESSAPIPDNYDNVKLTTVLPVPQRQLFTLPSLYNGTEGKLTASPYSWLVLPEQGPILDYQNTINTSYFLYILYDTKNGISRAKVTSKFTVSILETACVYFGEESQQWLSDGCKVGPLSNTTHIHCQCDHLTKFSGFVPPNPLRFDKVFSANVAENLTGIIAVLAVFGLFVMGCLLARKADRADLQKVGVTVPTGLQLNSDIDNHYVITVYTGYRAGAGTTAQVSIVLFGFIDESEPLHLCDDRRVLFDSGSEDSFLVSTGRRLGPLTHVHVWHNNAGFSPGWFLSRVVVKHVRSGRQDYFICNKWLALEEGDGRINRMIFVASPEEMSSLSNLITQRMSKDAHDGHLYYSMIGRPARSSFTRVQRLTCCMCTVYSTMVTNIMFFGQGDKFDPPEPVRFMGVEFELPISLPEIMIGVQSAAMIVPVTSAIVFLYRNASPRPSRASPKVLTEPAVVQRGQRSITTVDHQPEGATSVWTPPRTGAIALSTGLTERHHAVRHLHPSRTDRDVEAIELVVLDRSPGSSTTAGALAWSVSFVAAFFVVMYTLSFGRAKAEAWLITFITSFVTDMFLLQPVKLMAAAVGVVLIFRKPMNDDELTPAETTDDEEYLDILPKHLPSDDVVTELPGDAVLAEDRARRLRKKKVRGAVKEILLYGMFVCVLMLTSYGERSSLAFHMNKAVSGYVVDGSEGTPFSSISDVTSFWQWVDTTLIPATHSPPWYNRQTSNHSLHLPDHMTHLIAPLRFRQVRTRQEQHCTVPDAMANVSARCLDGYSVPNADTSNYNGSWDAPIKPNLTFTDDNSTTSSPWHFTYGNIADGFAYIGKHGTYNTGGYVATLNWTFNGSMEMSTDLRTKNWLDEKTRAVFVEMVLYNPHANLFSVVVMVTEFSITGSVSMTTEMTTFTLHHRDQVTLLVLRVAMALFVLYYLIEAVMNFGTRPLEYLTEAWSWLEIFIIFSATTTLGLYFRAQGVMDDIAGHRHENHFFLLTMFMSIIMDVYAESREVTNPDQIEIMQFLKDEAAEAASKLRSFTKKQKDCRPDLEKKPQVTLQGQIQDAMEEIQEQNVIEEVKEQRRPRERRIHFIGNDEVFILK
ncbi:PKD1L3 [Branchiostoma lanceolatum]|uniref:PKD1L3 protein n=1 Tax=Branchiostoma lanceolatum TaxID=7740 RepID=A0A8K0EU53_BRALA|nr:PKD1L3 [Branchiostoma lanceolatum]